MSFVPTLAPSGEEWPDAEFDFLDEEPIHASDAESDKEDEDWDVELDLGKTGGAKAHAQLEDMAARCVAARSQSSSNQDSRMVTIRPPIVSSSAVGEDDDDDGEGISTIKVSALSKDPPSDRKSTRLNSSHSGESRMPSSA